MHKGQEILEKQNQEESLEMLLAQRKLYSQAKVWQYTLIGISILIPIIVNIVSYYINFYNNWWYLVSMIILIIGEIIIENQRDYKKQVAASIQEQFDLRLYNIPENPLLDITQNYLEIIYQAISTIKDISAQKDKLRNWYTKQNATLSTNLSTLICQRETIRFDQKLKSVYKWILIVTSMLTLIILLTISLYNNWSVNKIIIQIVFPLTPLIMFIYKECNSLNSSIQFLERLLNIIDTILKSCSINSVVEKQQLRVIQDGIFYNRIHSVLVPDWLYHILKNKIEKTIDFSIEKTINNLKN